MEVQKIPGLRNGSTYFTCAADAGYFYRSKSTNRNIRYLICVETNCHVRATCDKEDTEFIKLGQNHNHIPDLAKAESLILKNKLIRSAVATNQDLKSIYVNQSAQ